MSRVNANGYFDSEDSEEARYAKRKALNTQRLTDYKSGEYALGGGVSDPMPEDAPFYFKDYFDYYKTPRGYHPRSLNSNGGWNVIGCMSFMNQPILAYAHEIRSAVLVMHGEKAHSCYFGKDAFRQADGGTTRSCCSSRMPSTRTFTTGWTLSPSTSWLTSSRRI